MSEPDDNSMTGVADLANCDKEPIHLPGRIQSFGALISVSPDWHINYVSENLRNFIKLPEGRLFDLELSDIFGSKAVHTLRERAHMLAGQDSLERVFGLPMGDGADLFDVALHQSGSSIIMEFERHEDSQPNEYVLSVRAEIEKIRRASSPENLCDLAAHKLKSMVGFDRVMVYRFASDGSGEVVAEAKREDLETFLDLRYPATDIPRQARELYVRNSLRIISDIDDPCVPITSVAGPGSEPLDLSLSTTRAVSPIHIEYLRNMGVQASLSISILKHGKLWGLFACHHYEPKILSYELRTVAELFGQLFAFVLGEKEMEIEQAHAERARSLHEQLMTHLAGDSCIRENFDIIVDAVQPVIEFDGAAGLIDGELKTAGKAPEQDQIERLVDFLATNGNSGLYITDCLSRVHPEAELYADVSSGILALPVSRTGKDYIIFFRGEAIKSVTWAGNPAKAYNKGPNGARLTPRKSFEAWQEVMRNHSMEWTDMEIKTAESFRVTLQDVILRISEVTLKERKKFQEHQEFLIAELNHRVRNILNLIRSLIAQSKGDADSISEFTKVVDRRIHALARAHDQITMDNWDSASFFELVRTEAAAYLGEKAQRVEMRGADCLLQPKAFTPVSLVIHEMITNSAKYGALCDRLGKILVDTAVTVEGDFRINWMEYGGPVVSAPVRRGFGSVIIERSIPFELNGETELTYAPEGLQATFLIPAEHIEFPEISGVIKKSEPERRTKKQSNLRSALVVEDNMIIAMEAENCLRELGVETVYLAGNVPNALKCIKENSPQFVLLDINLGTESSRPIAEFLVEEGKTFFAFATGYGDTNTLQENFPDAPLLQKPYSFESLAELLDGRESK